MKDIKLVSSDTIIDSPNSINYTAQNPLLKLIREMENASFFAESYTNYLADSLQFLFPYNHVDMYGPAGADHLILNPENQDNKTDFQKQNIKDFTLSDTSLVRGWVTLGNWTGSFLKISYRGDTDSSLSQISKGQLSSFIYLYLKIKGKDSGGLIKVPYNTITNRYEIEIWGYPNADFYTLLSPKGQKANNDGLLIRRPDLLPGSIDDFKREGLDDKNMYEVSPDNIMHPILALPLELAWSDHTQTYWDSQNGKNYHYSFNMILRGWDNFMQVGVSGNPHGGVGFLHYRNLLSNYKPFTKKDELSRPLTPWMFDANDFKGNNHKVEEEDFFAVDYMDLHVLKAECGIGIHRHRDNQEVFFLLNGKALMVTGDWYKFEDRERAFEIRTLKPGSFTLLKAGQLHALMNLMDSDSSLLMFGGYD